MRRKVSNVVCLVIIWMICIDVDAHLYTYKHECLSYTDTHILDSTMLRMYDRNAYTQVLTVAAITFFPERHQGTDRTLIPHNCQAIFRSRCPGYKATESHQVCC